MQLLKELQRRNVFRVAIGYVISCWLLMQVADLVFDIIGSPEWVLRTLAALLALGFPIVLFFSWAYEVTPEGIKRESEVDRSKSIVRVTGRKLDRAIMAMLVLALAYFIWESRFSDTPENADPGPVSAQATSDSPGLDPPEPVITRQSIAVLPFDNRSNRQEDEFFTEGIHDDLLTTIAKIGSMKVISRTSVLEYRDTTKKIPVIARELGVANILEGGVQRSGDQVRINVQLIDAQTDEHLWAEIFDRQLTAQNLFAIQSEISKAIADALQATLSPEEILRIDTTPTENLMAYNAYLRGRQLMATRQGTKLIEAAKEFNKAVELDPEFALAWVAVADSSYLAATYNNTPLEDTFSTREQAIEKALSINDQSGEAYTSLGTLYGDREEPENEDAAFKRAIQLSPNYAPAYHWYGNRLRNDPFRMDEAIQLIQKAAELDPRSSIIRIALADSFAGTGLYSLAEQQYLDLIELDPDFAPVYNDLAFLYGDPMGRLDLSAAFAEKAIERDTEHMWAYGTLFDAYVELGQLARAEEVLSRLQEASPEHPDIGYMEVMLNVYSNNPQGAREAIRWALPRMQNEWRAMYLAWIELSVGSVESAREMYLSVEPGWLEPDTWAELLWDGRAHACVVSWILMHSGEEALGRRLLAEASAFREKLSESHDHPLNGGWVLCDLAEGDTEEALHSAETLLAHNHLTGWDILEISPIFEAIRHEPRYRAAKQERDRRIAKQSENLPAR